MVRARIAPCFFERVRVSTTIFGGALVDRVIPWLQRGWPLDWDAEFGRSSQLALEIGFGNGAFLLELARRHPQRNHVGVELSWGSVQRVVRRLQLEGLDNVRVLEGDAAWLLAQLFTPESLDEVIVNFSDPWPKTRHHGRRLIRPAVVRLLGQRLKRGGTLTVVTDHAGYAAWIGRTLAGQAVLVPALETPVVHQLPGRAPTKYEQKALDQGRVIHYFVWRKGRPALEVVARPSEVSSEVPNVQLNGKLDVAAALRGLKPQIWRETHPQGQATVKLHETYLAADGDQGMVTFLVQEDGFSQQFGVLVCPQAGERVLVKLGALGYPRPTWGAQRAVRRLVELLLVRQPGLRVASSTVGAFRDGEQ